MLSHAARRYVGLLIGFLLLFSACRPTQVASKAGEPRSERSPNRSIDRMLKSCEGSLEANADLVSQHADQFARHDLRELTVYRADDDTILGLAKITCLKSLDLRDLSASPTLLLWRCSRNSIHSKRQST